MAETGSIYEAYYKLHPDDLILCVSSSKMREWDDVVVAQRTTMKL